MVQRTRTKVASHETEGSKQPSVSESAGSVIWWCVSNCWDLVWWPDLFDGGFGCGLFCVFCVRGLIVWDACEGARVQPGLDKGVDEAVPGSLVRVAVDGKVHGDDHDAVCDCIVDWRELCHSETFDIPSLQKRPYFPRAGIGVTTLAVMPLPHCDQVFEEGRH